jgi:hypothetical protein
MEEKNNTGEEKEEGKYTEVYVINEILVGF